MNLIDPPGSDLYGGASGSSESRQSEPQIVSFHRRELTLILNVYGRMLNLGVARDYAIDHLRDRAVFSIFRKTSETPLYRIEKRPRDALRQGAYCVSSSTGGMLKRGRDLSQVLKVFDRKLIQAVE
ncbi:MAG: DUF2794 domain-containing protein [Pseudomonadota bacterium]